MVRAAAGVERLPVLAAAARRTGAGGAAAGQVRGQPVPRRPGRLPARFPRRAGRISRARAVRRGAAAPAGRGLPAGAVARRAGGERGALLLGAAAGGGHSPVRVHRQPGAARARGHRRVRAARCCALAGPALSDLPGPLESGRARAGRTGAYLRAAGHRPAPRDRPAGARCPGHRHHHRAASLTRDVSNLESLRRVGEYLDAAGQNGG